MLKNLKHYLIPHHSNNYKAKALHNQSLIIYIFLMIFTQSFYSFLKNTNSNVLGFATDISVDKILYLVNQERIKANLTPLAHSPQLSLAAKNKSEDMFSKNYWAHISPTGTTPWEFITASGYQYVYAGENLAKSFDNSEEVVSAWMKSPSHKANILKPEYTEIGLAVKNGVLNKEETTLVVEEFGSKNIQTVAKIESLNNGTTLPQSEIAAASSKSDSDKFYIFKINRTLAMLIAEILLIILFIDSLFIFRHKTLRIQGHSMAHIMFILALLGALSATGIGAIL